MKRVFSKMISINYYSISNLIIIILFAITTFSCSNDDGECPETTNGISQEIKDLIYFRGDENAPTVLINAQGGPSNEFDTVSVDDFFENYNTTGILTVNVHQVQTLNPGILDGNDITLEQAINFNTESIEILSQVINYFKNDGRKVYVLGISFGAFLVQELIAKKGINVADKYLILTGRLDINDIMWQALSEGIYGTFENGVNPILESNPDMKVIERNYARLSAGLGMNRYTQLLNTIQDLSDITYVYGMTDEAVGSLTAAEVQFLESKNTNIIAGNGDHTQTFIDFFDQGINEAFGIE